MNGQGPELRLPVAVHANYCNAKTHELNARGLWLLDTQLAAKYANGSASEGLPLPSSSRTTTTTTTTSGGSTTSGSGSGSTSSSAGGSGSVPSNGIDSSIDHMNGHKWAGTTPQTILSSSHNQTITTIHQYVCLSNAHPLTSSFHLPSTTIHAHPHHSSLFCSLFYIRFSTCHPVAQ